MSKAVTLAHMNALPILIEAVRRLPDAAEVLAQWDKARTPAHDTGRPTRMNGGIPPNLDRFEVVTVVYMIGTGKTLADPLRTVTAYYRADTLQHLFTVDTYEPV